MQTTRSRVLPMVMIIGAISSTMLTLFTFQFLNTFVTPQTPLEWIVDISVVIFAIALLIFTCSLYTLVLGYGFSDLLAQRRSTQQPPQLTPSSPAHMRMEPRVRKPRRRPFQGSRQWLESEFNLDRSDDSED